MNTHVIDVLRDSHLSSIRDARVERALRESAGIEIGGAAQHLVERILQVPCIRASLHLCSRWCHVHG